MADVDGGRITVRLQGRDQGLSTMLTKIAKNAKDAREALANLDKRVSTSRGVFNNTVSALDGYGTKLSSTMAMIEKYTAAQKELLDVIRDVRSEHSKKLGTLIKEVDNGSVSAQAAKKNNVLRDSLSNVAAGYYLASEAFGHFKDLIDTGNALESQTTLLKALSGSTEMYEKNLEIAKQQQNKFGGSLMDNTEAIAQFANLANRTGVEMNELIDISRGLAIIDPVQGFKGAGIALKEFFSGDITSLARRFEIPRDVLSSIEAIADPIEKVKALRAALAELGITQELIDAQANTTATTYAKLYGSFDDAKARLGQLVAVGLEPAAEGFTKLLNSMAGSFDALANFNEKTMALNQGMIQSGMTYEQYAAQVQANNNMLASSFKQVELGLLAFPPLYGILAALQLPFFQDMKSGFDELTEAQFNFTKAALASGESMEYVTAINEASTKAINEYITAMGYFEDGTEPIKGMEEAIINLMAVNREALPVVLSLIDGMIRGKYTQEEVIAAIEAHIVAAQWSNQVTQERIQREQELAEAEAKTYDAIREKQGALNELTADEIIANTESEKLKAANEKLQKAAMQAALGMGDARSQAYILAAQFGISEDKAYDLITALREVLLLQGKIRGIETYTDSQGRENNRIRRPSNAGVGSRDEAANSLKDAMKRATEAEKEMNAALKEQNWALADNVGKLRILEAELANLTPGTAAYIRKQTELKKLEQQIAKEREKSGKSAAKAAEAEQKKLQKEAEKQLNLKLTLFEKLEDAERDHQEKILDIIEDYNKKQAEAMKDNETDKRRSRYDFYSGLMDSSLSQEDKAKFSAAYEQIFAEAQAIAQTGNAKLSKEFLELKEQHLSELQALAEAESDIRNDKGMSRKEKEAALAALAAKKALLEDAQNEELKQLESGGDEYKNEYETRLAEEARAYAEKTAEIIKDSDAAADAKIEASDRVQSSLILENALYQEQVDLIQKIRDASGGSLPAHLSSVGEKIANEVDTSLTGSGGTLTSESSTSGFMAVRDQGVIETITDQTIRLEAVLAKIHETIYDQGRLAYERLTQINNSINSGKSLVQP